jgi:hypothetical protein
MTQKPENKILPKTRNNWIQSNYLNAAYTITNDLNYSHIAEQDLLAVSQIRNGDTTYQFQKTSKIRDISNKERKLDGCTL